MLTQEELITERGVRRVKSMPSSKIKAFLEEFPWIRKIVKKPIAQVYVSRLEPMFLNYSPEFQNNELVEAIFFPLSKYVFRTYENIYLLDKDGKIIIVEVKKHRKRYFIFGPMISKVKKFPAVVRWGSTVHSMLDKMGGKADSVRFILSYYEYEYEDTRTVIVYKLPKGVSMLKWIQGEVEMERGRFQNVC